MDNGLVDLAFAVGGVGIALLGSYLYGLLQKRPDYKEIEDMVQRMVNAAQQQWDKSNDEKFDYVYEQLSKWLNSKGWNISPDLIEMFVENAVRLLRREEKAMGVADQLDDVDDVE